ncbi:MAG: DUF1800 domain-containing protein [Verrucomicrobiales bacterium]|nr:DUF1800 domain-containing protein [Verrucomicrobiales bacterium]
MLPSITNRRWNEGTAAHLLNRAGFGGSPAEVARLVELGPEGAVESLLDVPAAPSGRQPTLPAGLEADPGRVERLRQMRDATPDQRTALRRAELMEQRRRIQDLRLWWLGRMISGRQPLEDKLVLFWHGHFATSVRKVRDAVSMARQWETLRRHASGSWKQLLLAMTRDPAMLIWLDQAQSRREHPNENFARELLELFSLGEGHYTERDVTEAARSLTGLSLDRARHEFVWRPAVHDDGPKEFLGATGRWGPEDIIERIVAHPESSPFIVDKLWRFFAEESPEPEVLQALTTVFRESGHEFRPMLRVMFLSEAFYTPRRMRSQIKSPVQWLVMAVRQLERRTPQSEAVLAVLRDLGQELFAPPNVKGWDGGVAWINTATLARRMQLSAVLVKGRAGLPEMVGGARGEQMRMRWRRRSGTGGATTGSVEVDRLFEAEDRKSRERLVAALAERFLQSPFRSVLEERVREALGDDEPPAPGAILNAIQTILASTDYQLV